MACRYQLPVGVGGFFDATVNAALAPTPQDGAQDAARQTKKVKRDSSATSAPPEKSSQVVRLEPVNACPVCEESSLLRPCYNMAFGASAGSTGTSICYGDDEVAHNVWHKVRCIRTSFSGSLLQAVFPRPDITSHL